MPELQAARGLNLHKLPAKAAFDAQVAVGYGVVERRSYLHDLAFLRVHSQVTTDATVRTDRIRLYLPRVTPSLLTAHVIFGFEHQRARGADADTVATINAGRFRQRNFEFSGNVRAVTASGNRDRKGILRLDAAGLHAFVAEDAFGVIADVKFIVYFHRLRMVGGIFTEARGICAVTLVVLRKRGPGGKIHGRAEKLQYQFAAEAHAFGIGVNHHPSFQFARASGHQHARAFKFHNAEPANIHRRQIFEIAERRRFDAQLAGGFENRCAFADKKRVAVDFDFHQAQRLRGGRSGQRASRHRDR